MNEGEVMRVTLDYDSRSFLTKIRIVSSWLILKAISRGQVYGRRSANKNVHLKCHYLKITFRVSLFLRVLLGDDRMRIRFDIRRVKKPKQILWSEKDHKLATRWTRSLLEVIV